MAETKLHIKDKTLAALLKTDFTQFENTYAAFRHILLSVSAAIHVPRVGIWMLKDQNLISKCLLNQTREFTSGDELMFQDYPEYFKAINTGLPLVVGNAKTHESTKGFTDSYLNPLGIGAMLDVPIHEQGNLCGILCCENLGGEREWKESEIYFASLVANLISLVASLFKLKKTEKELHQERALLKTIVDNLPINVFVKDKELRRTLSNKEDFKFLGAKSESEVIGKGDGDLFTQEHAELTQQQDRNILKTEKPLISEEFSIVRPMDGKRHKYIISKIPIRDTNNDITGILGIALDITERAAITDRVRESEKRFRFITENTSDGIFVTEYGLPTYYSPSCERILGYSFEEILEINKVGMFDLIHPEYVDEVIETLEKAVFEQEENVTLKLLAKHKDGQYLWLQNSLNYFYDSEGKVWRIIVVIRDMTDAFLAERKLIESEQLLAEILHSLDEAVWAMDLKNYQPLFLSQSFERMFGFTLDDWKRNPTKWMDVVHPDDQHYILRVMEDVRNDHFENYTVRVVDAKGDIRWIENRGKVLLDESGVGKMILGMAQDITEKVNTLKELEKSEGQLSNILNSLDEVVWAVNWRTGELLFVSQSFEKVYGIPVDEWFKERAGWSEFIIEEDKEVEEKLRMDLFEYGIAEGNVRIKDAKGELKWLQSKTKFVYDKDGEAEIILGVSLDITEQVLAEESLKSSERDLRDILNALDEAVWAVSIPEYKPSFVSSSFEKFYGFTLKEWEKDWRLWEKSVYPDDLPLIESLRKQVLEFQPVTVDCRIVHRNGTVRWVENIAKTVFDDSGKPYLLLGIAIDRTSKKEAEEKLGIVKKQAIQAEMARAELELKTLQMQMNPHFIFNSLNSIQSFILKNDILSTNNYLSKFASLIRAFLDSSRKANVSLSDEISLLKLYVEMEQMRFDGKFTFEINVDPSIDRMFEIPGMMLQPFVENAINHGIRYKKSKGVLKVSFQKEGKFILCKIEDDGVGRKIAQEILKNTKKGYVSQGLKITQERFETYNALHQVNISYEISDLFPEKSFDINAETGTMVKVYFPIVSKSMKRNKATAGKAG